MSVHLAGIRLRKYCGYKKATFRFLDKHDKPMRIAVLYGPNGEGKSSVIEAIRLAGNPMVTSGRDCRIQFRKLIYNTDYDPTYGLVAQAKNPASREHLEMAEEGIETFDEGQTAIDLASLVYESTDRMEIEAAFDIGNDEMRTVLLTNEGLLRNELEPLSKGYSGYIDADHPMNMQKFQLDAKYKDLFLEMATTVYDLECGFSRDTVEEKYKDEDGMQVVSETYNDFSIRKADGALIHFNRMSAGERKIATFLSHLCEEGATGHDIILVDNVDLHLYFKRHAKFLDCMLANFPEKQFIVTCHSGTMIEHVGRTYGEECLFDVSQIKKIG